MKNELYLTIHSRKGVLFNGAVSSLSSVNSKGKLDILPMHSNFISLISEKVVYRDAITKQEHTQLLSQAVLRAASNKVDVYLGLTSSV